MFSEIYFILGPSFSSIFNPIAANYSTYFGFSQVGISPAASAASMSAINSVTFNSADDEIVSFLWFFYTFLIQSLVLTTS